VAVGCCVEVCALGVKESFLVSVARDAAKVGGTSIPVSKSTVAPNPMKSPINRNLISARMIDQGFVIILHKQGSL
jgi:hypothetical protein